MISFVLSISATLQIIFLPGFEATIQTSSWSVWTTGDGTTGYCSVDDPAYSLETRSALNCAVLCRSDPSCRFINYNKLNRVCNIFHTIIGRLLQIAECQLFYEHWSSQAFEEVFPATDFGENPNGISTTVSGNEPMIIRTNSELYNSWQPSTNAFASQSSIPRSTKVTLELTSQTKTSQIKSSSLTSPYAETSQGTRAASQTPRLGQDGSQFTKTVASNSMKFMEYSSETGPQTPSFVLNPVEVGQQHRNRHHRHVCNQLYQLFKKRPLFNCQPI